MQQAAIDKAANQLITSIVFKMEVDPNVWNIAVNVMDEIFSIQQL